MPMSAMKTRFQIAECSPLYQQRKDGMILENLIIRTKINTMNIVKTEIDGVLIIEPRVFKDSRGYFFESFSQREFDSKIKPILGHSIHFV